MTTTDTAATPPKTPALIAFGRMRGSRIDQAAWFGETEVALAKKAALNTGVTWLNLATEEEREAARHLSEGVVTEGGRFSLSPVKPEMLAELQRLREVAKVREPEPQPLPSTDAAVEEGKPKTDTADPWGKLGIGSIVLAASFDNEDAPAGWWEAVIVGTEPDGFALRWRDCPDDPTVIRPMAQIAIMHARLAQAA